VKPQLILAISAMASGAALVVAIFSKVSLAVTLPGLSLFASLVAAVKWSRIRSADRLAIRAQLQIGTISGILATLAYDWLRLILVKVAGFRFAPFDSLPLFGYLMIGKDAPGQAALLAGIAYHYVNGITFAIAYCLLLGGRNWRWGILWALGLEAAMFTIYPGWLDLKAVMKEFTIVSLLGHVAYGTTLGILSQRALSNERRYPTLLWLVRVLKP
jgi:hypothetical protein